MKAPIRCDPRQVLTDVRRLLHRLSVVEAALQDNLSAWEDEEDSVQTEHQRLILRTRRVLATR